MVVDPEFLAQRQQDMDDDIRFHHVEMGLVEIGYGWRIEFNPRYESNYPDPYESNWGIFTNGVPMDVVNQAIRLARFAIEGPEAMMFCGITPDDVCPMHPVGGLLAGVSGCGRD